jgi:hypothetical protein
MKLRRKLKKIILKAISLIERIEYKNLDLDQEDPNKKIIEEFDISAEVLSDTGFVKAYKYLETQPYDVWFLETENGMNLECADIHILFDSNLNEVFVKDLRIGDYIMTDKGPSRITYLENTNIPVSMVDLSIDHPNHRYYTNGILSHNSITSSIILVWYLLFNHDKNAMILANVGDTAEELMDKIKHIIKGLPFFLKPGMQVNNVMSMRFDNGCRILAKTTTKTSGIGFTIHFLYMDEFAHINPNFIEAFFRSTYPTVSSSKVSRIIITSTPNGMNKFYEIYQLALEGKNSFNPIRVDWWQVPGRDDEWKQREIANLGSEELFNQEYGNQFLSSSTLLLGSNELKKIKRNETEFSWKEIECLHDTEINYENLIWHPKFNLEECDSPGKRYVFSIDLSEGNKGDYTVLNIFKVTPLPRTIIEKIDDYEDESDFFGLVQVGLFRDNSVNLEDFMKIVMTMCLKLFSPDRIKIALEMNYKGDIFYEKLISKDDFYEEMFLFTKHTENARYAKPGIKYNEKIKLKYCELLRSLVRRDRIIITEKKYTVLELFSFGLNSRGTYSAQSGHDDVAMSLVNLSGLFDGYDFGQMVGELFDELEDNAYKDIIINKIEGINSEDSDPEGFGKNVFVTKEGKSYKDFSGLI